MRLWFGIWIVLFAATGAGFAQWSPVPLDPTRNVAAETAKPHSALPEEYIWTAGDVAAKRADHNKFPWNRPQLRTAPHLFRTHFQVSAMPADATLYVAGPREAHVYLNGRKVGDFYSNIDAPINFRVFHMSVGPALRRGDNVLAIEAVRGKGVVSVTDSEATQQLAYGEVLAVKLLPARFGEVAPPLAISDGRWRSMAAESGVPARWTEADFDDAGWKPVESLGPIEHNSDFFQWSADAGMYGWPGYMGMSADLRTLVLKPVHVTHVFAGAGEFEGIDSLTGKGAGGLFSVTRPPDANATDADAPSILLDFGREISGRLLVESASHSDSVLSIAYGESELEAMATGLTPDQQGGNYLGTNILDVPANGVARGPKSGFRYVRVRFLRGAPSIAFNSIQAEAIYYPVQFAGSFDSSDPLLNRIWDTGAYTAHLCMQDGIWDAPKRDRGRWVGDLDVEGRVISTAFGDSALIEHTLSALVPPGSGFVNGIAGYSALWLTSLENVYLHSGDAAFLASQRESMQRIVAGVDASLEPDGSLRDDARRWLFVDWAPGLYGHTQQARIGTELQYVRGYQAAARLFGFLKDEADAAHSRSQAEKILKSLGMRPDGEVYGHTWQLNALGALVQGARPNAVFWDAGLSHVKQEAPEDQVISPYFNSYVLDAMSRLGHSDDALKWIRAYWGGMLAEGATSFWESYDLRWPKANPHLSLQADGTSGYFVSMAHGWSSGPTAWLTENVLGVVPASPGYETVDIHPDLMGLEFASGTVPTPHGTIRIRIDKEAGTDVTLPEGIRLAHVRVRADGNLRLDGRPVPSADCREGICSVEITGAGHHTFGPR